MTLKILSIIPAGKPGSMSFVASQNAALRAREEVELIEFYLSSRTSIKELLKEAKRFLRIQNENCPDVLHANYGTMTGLFSLLLSRAPLVVTFRGSDINPVFGSYLIVSYARYALSLLAACGAVRIICVSSGLLQRLPRRIRKKACIIPSGIDLEFFKPKDMATCRAELGWDPELPVVVFNQGLNHPSKRLALAMTVIEILKIEYPRLKFIVFDGTYTREQIRDRLCAADCLLVTSSMEGSPNIVKEALACNLPIVSVDVGDVRERIEGVSVSFIGTDDPKELAVLISKVLVLKLKSNGREALKDLALDQTTSKVVGILSSACGYTFAKAPSE